MAEIKESSLIRGVIHVIPQSHGDDRGRFVETYRREWFPNGKEMVQGSRSDKQAGALVGLHFHLKQSDYWYVVRGRARIVLHDLRNGSPTEGATEIFELGDQNENGVLIPPGVAHGFISLTDMTLTYMVDGYYNPDDEFGIAWDDPALGIDWGTADPVVSDRDRRNPKRADLPDQPKFQP
jgi:dTDP-4-dehydrorhamnose 3,5-epimerase